MSNALFPTLPGVQIEVKRMPVHKTTIKGAVSGREYRARHMTSPRYRYTLSFEFLRDGRGGYDEFKPLLGFFNARGGSFDSWLFNDQDDNTATAQLLGVGNGVQTQFQVVRTLGGYVEPIYDLQSGTFAFYLNGVIQSAGVSYGGGVVTLATPPGAGVAVTWTGQFYWRCRFMQDQLDFNKFMHRLWSLKTCEFITDKP